ncbi:MAG: hypothetical protein R3C49_23445 [Planctomycetaceae bacterium]
MNTGADDLAIQTQPRWHRTVLLAAAVHSLAWGAFIIALPELSAKVYGFGRPVTELSLWQGTGLFIVLLCVGYAIASTDSVQHWAVVLIGLLAKILGPVGLFWSVITSQLPPTVLYLAPLNDVLWWFPFALILKHSWNAIRMTRSPNSRNIHRSPDSAG